MHQSQRPQLLCTTRWPQQVARVPRVPEPATSPAQPDSPLLPLLRLLSGQGLSHTAWPPILWLLQSWFSPECWLGLVYTSLCLHTSGRCSVRIFLLGYNLLNTTRGSQQCPYSPEHGFQRPGAGSVSPEAPLVTLALGPRSHSSLATSLHGSSLGKSPVLSLVLCALMKPSQSQGAPGGTAVCRTGGLK